MPMKIDDELRARPPAWPLLPALDVPRSRAHSRDADGTNPRRKGRPMSRRVADCRDIPSVSGCTLTIAGEENEVVRAASEHAVSVHGHDPGIELEAGIRAGLKVEVTV